MAGPLVATKLYVPKLRGDLVARPRLLERLRRAGSRLTLVSAPAGFGKTTLLAEWLDTTSGDDRAVAWVSLDPSDNEPARFWTYVVTALQSAACTVGSGALELLGSAPLATDGSQNRTPMIGSTISIDSSRCSRVLASWVAPQMLASVEYAFSLLSR